MNKPTFLTAASSIVLATFAFAGPPSTGKTVVDKTVVTPDPIYGRGFYVSLQAGMNAYQDFGGTRQLTLGAAKVALEPKEKIGFVGGLKLGYVFGEGKIRPAIEADVFYNGVQGDLDLRVNGNNTNFNVDANLHSVAAMVNALVRFGNGRFQPYVGAGVGAYWAEVDDVDVTIGNQHFQANGGNNSGLAWQLIGGADYYFTETLSAYLEYKFLNYEDAGLLEDRIMQHLVVLGIRWHF